MKLTMFPIAGTPSASAHYPDDDLLASAEGRGWRYARRDGAPL